MSFICTVHTIAKALHLTFAKMIVIHGHDEQFQYSCESIPVEMIGWW